MRSMFLHRAAIGLSISSPVVPPSVSEQRACASPMHSRRLSACTPRRPAHTLPADRIAAPAPPPCTQVHNWAYDLEDSRVPSMEFVAPNSVYAVINNERVELDLQKVHGSIIAGRAGMALVATQIAALSLLRCVLGSVPCTALHLWRGCIAPACTESAFRPTMPTKLTTSPTLRPPPPRCPPCPPASCSWSPPPAAPPCPCLAAPPPSSPPCRRFPATT